MGTLFIDRKNLEVRLDGGSALAFYANGEREGVVPLNPLKRVVIVGNVSLQASVLHKLCDEGIAVLFLSGRRSRFCGMLHGGLHNNGMLRVRQYEKSCSSFAAELAREIVERKITAQSDLLLLAREQRPDLRFPLTQSAEVLGTILRRVSGQAPSNGNGNGAIRKESLLGYEGAASTAYFGGFTKLFAESLGFTRRTRRPPRDPVNALLSLGYTLLHFEMVREIESIGLDPTIGFLHEFDYGRESLASDLVEPFRPLVDRFVWELFRERRFRDTDFAYDTERPGCYLKKGGRKDFYPLYEEWARGTRPLMVEEARSLARQITDGLFDLEEETLELRNRTRVTDAE